MKTVNAYYDELAATYDASRFGGSYGAFVDARERQLLTKWLEPRAPDATLDAGCGTGRLLGFAHHGVDASPNMLKVAHAKWPDRLLHVGELAKLPYADNSLDAVFCMHVFMHLSRPDISLCLHEFARVTKPGGQVIFDVPSADRRTLRRRGARSSPAWHGETALALGDLPGLVAPLALLQVEGLLVLPVHRLPPSWREPLRTTDAWLGANLPRLASYLMVRCQKPLQGEDHAVAA